MADRKRALVVGASRGVGRATALELGRRGFDVGLAFSTNRVGAEKAAAELPPGCASVLVQADLATDASEIVRQTVAGLGGVDVVVVTAVPVITGPIHAVNRDEGHRAMDVMVHGFRELALAAGPHLASGGGSIVVVSSLGSDRVSGFYGALGPAKAALEATVRYLAVSLGRDGIRVNAIAPGLIDDTAHAADAPEVMALLADTARRTPLRRQLPTSDDVARTIIGLLSDDLAFVTGEVLTVDGGYSLVL